MNKSKAFYNFAYNFLLEKTSDFITKEVIDSYLKYDIPENNVSSLNEIYKRMLFSAQSQNMYPIVIGNAIGGIDNLGEVLDGFNVGYVIKKYDNQESILLNDIEKELNPKGQIRKNKNSLWPKYCRTIISSAKFLNQFNDHKEFISWLDNYYNDNKSITVLPLLISAEVYGFGFALVCDFLKDLGYINFGKPDVHIKEIMVGYGLIKKSDSDYLVLKKMIQISKEAEITCFEFDRILWLIGSGNFYNHPNFGKNGLIGKMKIEFIKSREIFENSI